jgi:hypothetical protein
VWGWGVRMEGGGWMVDGLHIPTWNRIERPLAVAVRGAGKGSRGRDGEDDLINVH